MGSQAAPRSFPTALAARPKAALAYSGTTDLTKDVNKCPSDQDVTAMNGKKRGKFTSKSQIPGLVNIQNYGKSSFSMGKLTEHRNFP
jgi:hypothetical protein